MDEFEYSTTTSEDLRTWWNGQMYIHRQERPRDYRYRARLTEVTEVFEYDCE